MNHTALISMTGAVKQSTERCIIHVPRRFVAEEWGGTETVIQELSQRQQRAGFHPIIMTSMALASRCSEIIGGTPVRRFPHSYPFLGLSAADRAAMDKKGGNLLSLSLFTALLRVPRVRLFHAHALKRLGGEVRTAARLRRKPFVVSLHGGVFDVPGGRSGRHARADRRKTRMGPSVWCALRIAPRPPRCGSRDLRR